MGRIAWAHMALLNVLAFTERLRHSRIVDDFDMNFMLIESVNCCRYAYFGHSLTLNGGMVMMMTTTTTTTTLYSYCKCGSR